MKSINKKDKINLWKNIESIDLLYEKIKNMESNKNIESFNLTLYLFDFKELNLSYSDYIKLFSKIISILKNYSNKYVELYCLEQDKIILFNEKQTINSKIKNMLKSRKFNIDNKKLSLSPQIASVNWPRDGNDFDSLLEKLLTKIKNDNSDINYPILSSRPGSVFINKKDDFLDKVEKISTQLYLIDKDKNIEIIKQNIIADRTFQVRGGEKGNFELFYILAGKVVYEEENIVLTKGDSISARSGEQEKYFKTITDTTLLYITSNPIFASEQRRIKELISLNEKIEEKDVETREHCDRLQKLSRLTAIELSLEEKKIFNLGFASFLHDIGKAKVPSSLLQKPDKLTKKEWELMKKHTKWGKEIILEHFNKSYFHKIAEIINQHHERWDGFGYPKGLSGNEILIEAQILSVVDAFDAMTYERPYQRAFSRKEAIEEIKFEKEKQFSPKAVEAFLKAEQKFFEKNSQ
ncbi:MAG TPA: HD-GYP domain-containing protein [Halanaerobiales bacterium]|nr:HD-GYP domain-containing protein [Halanaerobiales bacterium]